MSRDIGRLPTDDVFYLSKCFCIFCLMLYFVLTFTFMDAYDTYDYEWFFLVVV